MGPTLTKTFYLYVTVLYLLQNPNYLRLLNRLPATVYAELLVNVFQMRFNGFRRNK
jgi:hypothetical protein